MAEVIPLQQMDEAEYRKARTMWGDRENIGARWDQEVAKLFVRSGWSQDRLAREEGKDVSTISQMLAFGRFLLFSQSSSAVAELVPPTLTETNFRQRWRKTGDGTGGPISDRNERERFVAVLKSFEPSPEPRAEPKTEPANAKSKSKRRLPIAPASPKRQSIPIDELKEKLTPIIKALHQHGRLHPTRANPAEVEQIARGLEALLKGWTN